MGIGGYDLKSVYDKAFAFDFEHNGKRDYILLYRPGAGTICILQNTNGKFAPVYRQSSSDYDIGGYDLRSRVDLAFAYDYEGSGKLDYLAFYRPGAGIIRILKHTSGTFTPVYQDCNGIGGYDLKSPADRVFCFNFEPSVSLDSLVLYRAGTGTIWIVKKNTE